jgi:YfiH family protein
VADASWSVQPGVACALLVADCLPVLLTDTQGSFVAAAHAGWRGLSGGILDHLFHDLPHNCMRNTEQLMAWLGPCIGPTEFEVGDEVRLAFARHLPGSSSCFVACSPSDRHAPKWLADLPALARMALSRLGIKQIYGNNGSLPWCTFSNPSRFFSFRRERVCGRMGAFIGLLEP